LIESLRIFDAAGARDIVAFVDDDAPTLFNLVLIWGARPSAHQDQALRVSYSEVHAALEIHSKRSTHFQIRDDVA
jgi:hypothetical protein